MDRVGMGILQLIFQDCLGNLLSIRVNQLRKFRAGTRSNDPNGIMRDIAKRMTDEEIQAVSSYVSGLH